MRKKTRREEGNYAYHLQICNLLFVAIVKGSTAICLSWWLAQFDRDGRHCAMWSAILHPFFFCLAGGDDDGGEEEKERDNREDKNKIVFTQKSIVDCDQTCQQILGKAWYARITNGENQYGQNGLVHRAVSLARHPLIGVFIICDLSPKPRYLQAFVNHSVQSCT